MKEGEERFFFFNVCSMPFVRWSQGQAEKSIHPSVVCLSVCVLIHPASHPIFDHQGAGRQTHSSDIGKIKTLLSYVGQHINIKLQQLLYINAGSVLARSSYYLQLINLTNHLLP